MKKRFRSVPAKAACFILCAVMLFVCIVSVILSGVIADAGLYKDTKEKVFEDNAYYNLRRDAYAIVSDAVSYSIYNESGYKYAGRQGNSYDRNSTNIRYTITDYSGKLINTNIDENAEESSADTEKGANVYRGNGAEFRFLYVLREKRLYEVSYASENPADKDEVFIINIHFKDSLPVNDIYAVAWKITCMCYALRYAVYPIAAVSFIAFVSLFVMLMCVSGRLPVKNPSDICDTDTVEISEACNVHKGFLFNVPADILIAAVAAFMCLPVIALNEFLLNGTAVVLYALLCFACVCAFIGTCVSIAARVKAHTLIRNTVLYRLVMILIRILKYIVRLIKILYKIISSFIKSIPFIPATLAPVICIVFLTVMIPVFAEGAEYGDPAAVFSLIITYGLIILSAVYAVYAAIMRQRLIKGSSEIAGGNFNYNIDTKGMKGNFKKQGENLNSISDGLARAVEERLKSEHMRAELITNVSHDIKTPLTSIINFSTLISEETCESEKHREYAEVLSRKALQLKRLLEDLVEISKASTGNLDMQLTECEANVLLEQAAGEFEQRCKEAGLDLVVSNPPESIKIMADSRRIWRVFENLMSNVCKYSLGGSRVYISLEKQDRDVMFIFKNISRFPLNMPAGELTERFVRGDDSRSTEGSGLGLSIAQSLTELQNGKMEITVDGDLFKVTLRFAVHEA